MAIDRFARVPLLLGPSPLHRLERLSEHLGGAVDIWAKREDCNSGLAYGGNKVRKLEYLAADALAQGCDTLVSIGGMQSNPPVRWRPSRHGSAFAASSYRSAGCSGRMSSMTRSATSSSRASWVPTCGSTLPASTSASGGAGRTRSRRSRRVAAPPMRFRPAPPTTRSAGSALRAGPTRWPRRSASSASFSTRSSSAP